MADINLREEKQEHDFQIVLLDKTYCPIRKELVPSGKKVSYSSNNGSDICDFFERHEASMKSKLGKKKRKRKKNRESK